MECPPPAPFSCLRMEPAGAIPFFRQARERENGRSTQSDDRKTHSKTHSPCQGEWVWGERDKPTTSLSRAITVANSNELSLAAARLSPNCRRATCKSPSLLRVEVDRCSDTILTARTRWGPYAFHSNFVHRSYTIGRSPNCFSFVLLLICCFFARST